jgi:hypothetical protein
MNPRTDYLTNFFVQIEREPCGETVCALFDDQSRQKLEEPGNCLTQLPGPVRTFLEGIRRSSVGLVRILTILTSLIACSCTHTRRSLEKVPDRIRNFAEF